MNSNYIVGDREGGRKPRDLQSCRLQLFPLLARRAGAGARAARTGERGRPRGSRYSPCLGRPASVWHAAGAKPLAGIAFTGLGIAFPTISAAAVSSAVAVAALAFPSQPPLLPACKTKSRSQAVAPGAGKPGLEKRWRGAGKGSPSRHHVEFGTALE